MSVRVNSLINFSNSEIVFSESSLCMVECWGSAYYRRLIHWIGGVCVRIVWVCGSHGSGMVYIQAVWFLLCWWTVCMKLKYKLSDFRIKSCRGALWFVMGLIWSGSLCLSRQPKGRGSGEGEWERQKLLLGFEVTQGAEHSKEVTRTVALWLASRLISDGS